MTTVGCCVALALLSPALAAGQEGGDRIVSVPPAEYRPAVVEKAAPATLTLATGAPAHRVELMTATASEVAALKVRNAVPYGQARRLDRKALTVGFGRDTPAAARNVSLAELTWAPITSAPC